jgi:hypothetical protein
MMMMMVVVVMNATNTTRPVELMLQDDGMKG